MGNPFSPSYARDRATMQGARPLDHCAMNVAIYRPRGRMWALRERRIGETNRDALGIAIGRSTMRWVGDALRIDIDETTSPFARRLRGQVTFRPALPSGDRFSLDAAGRHSWWPVAPAGRVEVALEEPSVRFDGDGYHDANAGDLPLEATFARWNWSRARLGEGRTSITYDVFERTGGERRIALEVDRGEARSLGGLDVQPLASTAWRIPRAVRVEEGRTARVVRELEDTPFYSRSLVETWMGGRRVVAMHEALSLERFELAWVRFLLGFRMGKG